MGRRPLPRLRAPVVALAVIVVLAGCDVPAPQGAGVVRYRDQLFGSVTKSTDIQYGTAAGADGKPTALELDAYEPVGDPLRSRPALIWVHGGGFAYGDKSGGATNLDMVTQFAQRGYVTFSINYRLLAAPNGCDAGGGVTATCYAAASAAIDDGQAAVRYVRSHAAAYGVDPSRIGIGGESAGAIVATGVGLHAESPTAGGDPAVSDRVRGFFSFSGGLPGGLYATPDDAPGVLVSGTADTTVPYAWSVQTAAALLGKGVAAFLEPLEGQGHVPYGEPYGTQVRTQARNFFYLAMDLGHAAGQPAATRRSADRQALELIRRHPRLAQRFGRGAVAAP